MRCEGLGFPGATGLLLLCVKCSDRGEGSQRLFTGQRSQWKRAELKSSLCNVTASCSVLMLSVPGYTASHNNKRHKSTLLRLTGTGVFSESATKKCLSPCLRACERVRFTLTILCCRCFFLSLMNSLCCLETKFTAAYSSRAANTNRRHTAIQMSMAFT